MKRLVPALWVLAAAVAAQAQFTLATNNGAITITGYTGAGGIVSIPSSTNGLQVVSIGDRAFEDCTNLTSVTIPNSVTDVEDYAFEDCSNLISAYFQGNAPAGGAAAFATDPAVRLYYLSGATGWSATFGGAPTVEETAATQFQYTISSGTVTITGFAASGPSAVIPDLINGYPVTYIATFDGQTSMTNVTIPNSVTNIGRGAFEGCSGLTSVTFCGCATSIGDIAFDHCINLTSVTIPNYVNNIGDEAFLDCTSLASVTVGNSVINIGSQAFSFCTNLSSVTIGNSVTNIGVQPFQACSSLTNISVNPANPAYNSLNGVLFDKAQDMLLQYPLGLVGPYSVPNTVTNIGPDAFNSCGNLSSVIMGNSVTSIGEGAFGYCTSLTSATIPNSVTSIGEGAFEFTSLTSATVPNSVTSIGEGALGYCTSLTNIQVSAENPAYSSLNGALFDRAQNTLIQYPTGLTNSAYTIPDTVTGIGPGAFGLCANLARVTIPVSVTSIGGGAFSYCTSLTSLPMGNSVTSIGDSAFTYCTNLTTVTIPDTVTNIGDYAFLDCYSLTAAYFQGNAPMVDGGLGSADTTTFSPEPGIVYYVPGNSGWSSSFGGWPTALWYQPQPQILGGAQPSGANSNGFNFTVSWATNTSIVIEACTNLSSPVWAPLATNILVSGTNYFSDGEWANFPNRYYRISSQ